MVAPTIGATELARQDEVIFWHISDTLTYRVMSALRGIGFDYTLRAGSDAQNMVNANVA